MVVAGEVALGRTQPHHEQHDRAQQHVRAVEAGQHEERRPVDARAQRSGSRDRAQRSGPARSAAGGGCRPSVRDGRWSGSRRK
ncbi:hypothetical protein G6F40_015507 [Rhizopus arrhizus]|nr:hypothetical protein G6F40_015507 [Rhizopus arrhizus]